MRRACRLNCDLTYKRSPSKRHDLYLTPRFYSMTRSIIESIQHNLQAYFSAGRLSRISHCKKHHSQIERMKGQLSNAIEDYKVSFIGIVASMFPLRNCVDKEHIRAQDYGSEHRSASNDSRTRAPAGNGVPRSGEGYAWAPAVHQYFF